MTKGRKPNSTAVEVKPALDEAATKKDTQVLDVLAIAQSTYSEDRDLVNQLLGQAQALSATSALLQTFGVSKLAFVKEHKLYKALVGKSTTNGLELKGTWEEFCGLLGMSDEKANQDIANLRAFGEEALENMSRMGIGYRDLRQFRRLPDDQKTALIEVAKSGDKDDFLELAESLISRHVKEKEELVEQLNEVKEDASAKDRIIDNKTLRENDLLKKLAAYEGDRVPADERLKTVVDATDQAGKDLEEAARDMWAAFEAADTVTADIFDKPLSDQDAAGARQAVARIRDQINRAAATLAELQFNFEQRLAPVLAGHEDFVLQAGAEE